MPYTYFRKKIFRKYVLIFTLFYMIGRRFCSSSVSELVFQGVSLLTGLFVASPRYPPGFSLLSLTLYAPAMPEERYDDFFLN